ncbi:response regulator [Sphingomonas psychrotolerans]|uniref:Response regulator n=1 Tax=Sphingomonas psychrotolerans TaxID=1327635 RepID=A0ABU3N3N8_9SPHN|nr:response regulator [Sphingomonas psychrotolerans]MDT8758901.1 response regulator [Sphingomonas psychrotolerans]
MADPNAPRTLRVLIVEDEALIAWTIEDALSLQGHEPVGIADNYAAALAMADAEKPDLALCDVKLARGDSGIAVAEALGERGIPSLFLSGNCPEAAHHRLIVGAMEKPFRMDSLGQAIAVVQARMTGAQVGAVPAGMTLYDAVSS